MSWLANSGLFFHLYDCGKLYPGEQATVTPPIQWVESKYEQPQPGDVLVTLGLPSVPTTIEP